MPVNAPQKLSVKRKRGDAPVESLVIADSPKRVKSDRDIESLPLKRKLEYPQHAEHKRMRSETPTEGRVIWRLVQKPALSHSEPASGVATPTSARRFHVSRTAGNVVLFEHKPGEGQEANTQQTSPGHSPAISRETPAVAPADQQAPQLRKRPGASARRVNVPGKPAPEPLATGNGPSADVLAKFEKFSAEVEAGLTPSRPKPKAPRLRYAERHPNDPFTSSPPKPSMHDPDAMEIDTDYVIDTYIQEILPPSASDELPHPSTLGGSVGYIVLTEEDEEWWYDNDAESEREFDTDDEDSNAEEYYANDYPEDELSDDDEFDRNPYAHYRDENDDLYDLERDEVRSDDEVEKGSENEMFGMRAPKAKAVYWGKAGEV